MLGLGASITKGGVGAKTIVTDSLVLKHDYAVGAVQPLSDGAAIFDASGNDYIAIGNPSNLNMGTGNFSIAAWVNTSRLSTTQQIMGKRSGVAVANQGYSIYLGNAGTDWVFNVADGSDYAVPATPVAINKNQWYHVCGTFDGTAKTAKLYVDGVLEATTTNTDIGDPDVSDNFIIGGGTVADTAQKWEGYICNAGAWKGKILSQAEIKSIMNKNYAGLSDSEKTNLVSWWNLDEETATDGTAGTGGVKDHEGSNHGTLS